MTFVVITTEYGLADVSFKYDPDVIAIVKQIPSRAYVSESKYWTIFTSHVPVLANWLTAAGHTVSVNGERWMRVEPKSDPSGNPFTDLMKALPVEYREKTYKALCRVFHPDTGGDVTLMQKLNEAKP